MARHSELSPGDRLITIFDRALRTLAGVATAKRPMPGIEIDEVLETTERAEVAALMRVNHSGEVCAQALYLGQALMARDSDVAAALNASADDEVDHLAWTASRIAELGGRPSALIPCWFAGSFAIGSLVAAAGDRWSLAFLRETEFQVVRHLQGHLDRLPPADVRSRAILDQMRCDEALHAELAESLGGVELPQSFKVAMKSCATIMTRTAYYL